MSEHNTGHILASKLIDLRGLNYYHDILIEEIDAKYGGSINSIKNLVYITHSELKSKRDSGQLIPGQQYRIIDYITTTNQENTQSAGHQFDIIVTADDENTLNEKARAIQHEGDTYFANNDLNVWEIWYCLDNDTERFAWAYDENGKGVIYRMIDELGNDCPYDFKNIQFKRNITNGILDAENGVETYCYTFNAYCMDSGVIEDASAIALKLAIDDDYNRCYGNIIKSYNPLSVTSSELNDIVFLNIYEIDNVYVNCNLNTFGYNCCHNTFGDNCNLNTFGEECQNNSFRNDCQNNIFGDNCNHNTLRAGCCNNTFRGSCYSNAFGENCNSNAFGENCNSNAFGENCAHNSFGNNCDRNSFGNNFDHNSFGSNCSSNSFRLSASKTETLLNFCYYNNFDAGCSYNVIWNNIQPTSSTKLQNINVVRGVSGTSSAYNFINIVEKNVAYEIKVAKNSKGEIKIYCEADLIA